MPTILSSISLSCLSLQVRHAVSYTQFRFLQSCELVLPSNFLLVHSRQPGLRQSSPAHGLALWRISTNLVPPLSTILSLYPVILSMFSSLSLSLVASSECFVKGTNITPLILLLVVVFLLLMVFLLAFPLFLFFTAGVYWYALS